MQVTGYTTAPFDTAAGPSPDLLSHQGEPFSTRLLYLRSLWSLTAKPEIPALEVEPVERVEPRERHEVECEWERAWDSSWAANRQLYAALRNPRPLQPRIPEPEPAGWFTVAGPDGFSAPAFAGWLSRFDLANGEAWGSASVTRTLDSAAYRGLWVVYVLPVTGAWSTTEQDHFLLVSTAVYESAALLEQAIANFSGRGSL